MSVGVKFGSPWHLCDFLFLIYLHWSGPSKCHMHLQANQSLLQSAAWFQSSKLRSFSVGQQPSVTYNQANQAQAYFSHCGPDLIHRMLPHNPRSQELWLRYLQPLNLKIPKPLKQSGCLNLRNPKSLDVLRYERMKYIKLLSKRGVKAVILSLVDPSNIGTKQQDRAEYEDTGIWVTHLSTYITKW